MEQLQVMSSLLHACQGRIGPLTSLLQFCNTKSQYFRMSTALAIIDLSCRMSIQT
uniref:Uncharacterized protein n=1 Tax=Arundo donax TaxID=35708 RepID=A0A0A9BFM9_ARUDO